MKHLDNELEIWCLTPKKEDLIAGANYAAITLPWTFNRMMLNTGSRGQQSRGINIAKGIVVQEILKRELNKRGIKTSVQRKSHRDEDLFDFKVKLDGTFSKLDLKSFHYFTNYPGDIRTKLTPKYIIQNKDYFGSDWRKFFPMLIAHTQISQGKESYCFAISSSIDMRNDALSNRINYALTAYPFGEHLGFYSSRILCLAREESRKGFYVDCSFIGESTLFDSDEINITIIGEWDNTIKKTPIKLSRGEICSEIGPFSCLSSIQIEKESYEYLQGIIHIELSKYEFNRPILNSLKKNINLAPSMPLLISKEDFCNLILPSDFKVYFLGWIIKDDFIKKCKKYSGWVWPHDKTSKFDNQQWTQITEGDIKRITSLGFGECIQKKPSLLRAGWIKTSGRGNGGCCYVFPNSYGGGVKETNLYVLPSDLIPMELLNS
jgi:hypothetical protein